MGAGAWANCPARLDALGSEGRGVGLVGVGRAGYRGVGAVVQGLDFGIKRIGGPPQQGFGKPPALRAESGEEVGMAAEKSSRNE